MQVMLLPPSLRLLPYHESADDHATQTKMSAPNALKAEAVHPSTETPLPDCEASTQQVREWVKTWHKDHGVEVDEVTLTQVTWTGPRIHEQPPAQLESDIVSWGVPQRRARMMVLDLVRERRRQTKLKPASLTAIMMCRP
ncbi:hypothetical protein BGZ57DRAFT_855961 [Hyaloscypha finlandica]|nr:hypothetical protein BGZ57DRAFT_855961 [Hyaloscypha finlandica]